MKPDTWKHLDDLFLRYPALRSGRTSDMAIDAASHGMGIPFPVDYREFLLRHGSAIVGPYPVFGVEPVEAMGDEWSVIEMNRRYRADGWPGVEGWLIVSADHAGNPIGIDETGRVLVSDHDFGGVAAKAVSFEAFLREICLRIGV